MKTAKIVTDGTTETDNRYTYDNNGRLTQIHLAHFGLYRNQSYDDRGRITSSYLNTTSGGGSAISYRYAYDNYGNRTSKTYYYSNGVVQNYTWTRGRLLEKIANANNATIGQYTYDLNGVRYTKTADGVTTTYFYDGNTLLGENKSDGKRLRYFYDATGLCGFSYCNSSDTKYYTYVKDVLGNIVMIKNDEGLPLVRYTYNEWGVCSMTALNLDGGAANALETELGEINPFRYRGYYYDVESGLYYLMSRYYDPTVSQFLSPDTADYLAPETIGGVDLYAYCGYNPVMRVDNQGTSWSDVFAIFERIFTSISDLCEYIINNRGEFTVSWKKYHKEFPFASKRQFKSANSTSFEETQVISKVYKEIADTMASIVLLIDIGSAWVNNWENNRSSFISDSLIDTMYIGARFLIGAGISSICTGMVPVPVINTIVAIGVSIAVDYLIQWVCEDLGLLNWVKELMPDF